MIRKEIDGKTYLEFEPHEEKARKKFEEDVDIDDISKELADLFLAVHRKAKKKCREAWKELVINFPDLDNRVLKYHYLGGRVEVTEETCDPT